MMALARPTRLLLLGAAAACIASPASAQRAGPRVTAARPPEARVASARTAAAPEPQTPTLVVFLTVDQMRADYFERFGAQLTGGLGRLYRGGAFFTHAFQDHANTETAPGHATVLSGREPEHTGIVLNTLGVPDPQTRLIGSANPGASPFRFRGSTLIDWMRVRDPNSRALSISRKDRAAILPMGRAHQSVFWYAPEGIFTTSTYYADSLPAWVRAFNGLRIPQRMAGQAWTPLLPDTAYPEPDSQAVENGGRNFTFPHVLPASDTAAARQLVEFPWMDQLTLEAALAGVRAMRLGAGPSTDLLAVSLSTTDAVGHRYGPDSRELHDQIVRLDRYLGAFLDSLYAIRDSSRVIVALTADHGVTSFVELTAGRGNPQAQHVTLAEVAHRFRIDLARRGIDTAATPSAFALDEAMLVVDRPTLRRHGVDPDSLVAAFAAAVRQNPGVARVQTMRDLDAADTVNDAVSRRWVHAIPRDLPIELVVTLKPGNTWSTAAYAEHGQPSDDDAHVPILFYGAPFRPGRYGGFTRVTDIAPTLAAVLGVSPTEPLDGHALTEALRSPPEP
jgi:predicted AlkP superfamily pyrophosphatase or phosphodiesterase